MSIDPMSIEFDEYGDDDVAGIEVPNVLVHISRPNTNSAKTLPAWMGPLYQALWQDIATVRVTSTPMPKLVPGKRDRYGGRRTTKIIDLATEKERLRAKFGTRKVVRGADVQEYPLFDAVFPLETFEDYAAKAYPELFGKPAEVTHVTSAEQAAAIARAEAEEDAALNDEPEDQPSEDGNLKSDLQAELETLPGIGAVNAKILIERFNVTSIEDVAQMSVAELAGLKGVTEAKAEEILNDAQSRSLV